MGSNVRGKGNAPLRWPLTLAPKAKAGNHLSRLPHPQRPEDLGGSGWGMAKSIDAASSPPLSK